MSKASQNNPAEFKTGDRVSVHQRFARIFPQSSGVIVDVELDPFRPLFNEYIVQFTDGSRASAFQFQLARPKPDGAVRKRGDTQGSFPDSDG